MFDVKTAELDVGGRPIRVETGQMARQAHGAVLVSQGDTTVLVTAVAEASPKEGIDFFPLTVNYQTKTYAAGKIPGGFFKREGRPPDSDTLTSRLIDRPIRPLFADGFSNETQIIITVLSHDGANTPDMLGLFGTSVALTISDIPFLGPMAGVRVGMIDGEFVINPTMQQMEESDLDLIIAGTEEAITMVESGSKIISEDTMLDALAAGHAEIKRLCVMQNELAAEIGKPKREVVAPEKDAAIYAKAADFFADKGVKAYENKIKADRYSALAEAKKALVESLDEDEKLNAKEYMAGFSDAAKDHVRGRILKEKIRIDGRGPADIRAIDCDTSILARTHGSALFTRGETQALAVTTLGTSGDEQLIDAPEGSYRKKFMLHYNFPPFSVGEARFLRSPGRREIGHGALAERALVPVLPEHDDFPYTLRIVSEVLESNGSSSMASVCGGSLSLMDAGVPVKAPVAGIAMGLIIEGDDYVVLSDILGDEDHLGDMDFKVTGTSEGITALQMDIKVKGITMEIMHEALAQAREGRLHILGEMNKALDVHRPELSPHAPRITVITVNTERIKDVIGPGGKNIRKIIEVTQCAIDIQDDGSINIASSNGEQTEMAIKMIRDLTQEAEVGKIYEGTVRKIMDFGAFIEIYPGTDGLCHISEIDHTRVDRDAIANYFKEGDKVNVKVLAVDQSGRIKLSRKAALPKE